MSKLDWWIDQKVVQNLFVWFLLFLILLVTIQSDNTLEAAFFSLALLAPAVYVNNLLIVPFLRKRLLLFFLLFILNTILFTAVSVLLISHSLNQPLQGKMFLNFFGIMVLALVFATAIKLARDSFTRRQHEKEAELKLLKAQLNPHFLFNTLNNLYGLSVVKSNKLPNLMLKLSELLRYSLYETKETLVLLDREIKYLENYMALEKLRLEETTEIKFNKQGNFRPLRIAPMLLIVFVENAFKHLSVSQEKKGLVDVSVAVNGNQLIFNCVNSFDNGTHMVDDLEKGRSGIGLANVKKRLNLMYADKHQLESSIKDNIYHIALTLVLTP